MRSSTADTSPLFRVSAFDSAEPLPDEGPSTASAPREKVSSLPPSPSARLARPSRTRSSSPSPTSSGLRAETGPKALAPLFFTSTRPEAVRISFIVGSSICRVPLLPSKLFVSPAPAFVTWPSLPTNSTSPTFTSSLAASLPTSTLSSLLPTRVRPNGVAMEMARPPACAPWGTRVSTRPRSTLSTSPLASPWSTSRASGPTSTSRPPVKRTTASPSAPVSSASLS